MTFYGRIWIRIQTIDPIRIRPKRFGSDWNRFPPPGSEHCKSLSKMVSFFQNLKGTDIGAALN